MSAPRPNRLIVVVGTGTEVGKTWVTCALIRELRTTGVAVLARKPVQSFVPGASETDAALLAAASGATAESVCPPHRWYEVAMAPPMAAEALGRDPFLAADLADELTWPAGTDVGFVETAGGVRSPLATDADCADFALRLRPDGVLLVADAGLGTINAVRSSMSALGSLEATPVVFLNRFDPDDELHRRNREWLRDVDGWRVTVEPGAALSALGLSPDAHHGNDGSDGGHDSASRR